MLRTILKCLLVLMLGVIALVYGLDLQHRLKPVPEVVYSKYSDTLTIKGLIVDNNPVLKRVVPQHTDMITLSKQLLNLVKGGIDTVYITIDSPGGYLHAGSAFISLMRDAQSLGVKFVCIINGQAMSMATIIFTECNTRLATIGSKIMWHSVAQLTNGKLNSFTARKLTEELDYLNYKYWYNTRLHFYPGYWSTHFKNETVLSVISAQENSFMYLRVIREHIIQ